MKDAVKIRTQIKFAEEGEKRTRYFYSLERRNQIRAINVLTKDSLDTVTEAKDIITEAISTKIYIHLNPLININKIRFWK